MTSVKHFITSAGMLEDSIGGWCPVYNIRSRGGLGYHQHSITGGMIPSRAKTTKEKLNTITTSDDIEDEQDEVRSEIGDLQVYDKKIHNKIGDLQEYGEELSKIGDIQEKIEERQKYINSNHKRIQSIDDREAEGKSSRFSKAATQNSLKENTQKLTILNHQLDDEFTKLTHTPDIDIEELSTELPFNEAKQKQLIEYGTNEENTNLTKHLSKLEDKYKDIIEKNRQSKINTLTIKNQAKALAKQTKQNLANKMVVGINRQAKINALTIKNQAKAAKAIAKQNLANKMVVGINRQAKINALTIKNQAKALAKQNLAKKMVVGVNALTQQNAQAAAHHLLVDAHNNYNNPPSIVAKPNIESAAQFYTTVKQYFDIILKPLNLTRGPKNKYGYGNAFEFCAEYQLTGTGNHQVDAAIRQLNILGIIEWFSKDDTVLLNNANNPRIPSRLQQYSVIDFSKQYTDIEFKYWNTMTYTFNYTRLEEIVSVYNQGTTTKTVSGVPLQASKIIGNVSFIPLFIVRNGKWKLYNVLNIDTGDWVNEYFYKTYFVFFALEEGLYYYNITRDIETNNTNVIADDEFQPSKFEHKKIITNIEKINTTSNNAFHHIKITIGASGNKILETPAGEKLNIVEFTYQSGTDSHKQAVYYIDKIKIKFIG